MPPPASAPAPKVYQLGHVKRNTETGDVAVRTIFPEDQGPQLANMAWLVATTNSGARTLPTDQVTDWEDMYDPADEAATDPVPTLPPEGE